MKTESEIIQSHQQNLFLMEKQIHQRKFTVQELGEVTSGSILQLNSSQDLALLYMSPEAKNVFGRDRDEIYGLGAEALLEHLHPIIVERLFPVIYQFYANANQTDSFTYFQHIRSLGKKEYQPILTTVKKFKTHNQFIGLTVTNLKQMNQAIKKIEYMLEAEEFARNNFEQFMSLSPREKEILTLTAEGKEASEISDLLCISRHTVNGHRKKINQKLGVENFRDVIKYAIAFDLINI